MTTPDKVNSITTFSEANLSRMQNYRMHLRTITNGLIEMAKAAGRQKYTCNQLLRECYNLQDEELHTYEKMERTRRICTQRTACLPLLGSSYHE